MIESEQEQNDIQQDQFYQGAKFNAEKDLDNFFQDNIFHIRTQQRNGRKQTTIIEGLPHIYDEKKIVKSWKKSFNCIGTINKDKEGQLVITLSGDQRLAVQEFLINEGIGKKENIKIHGA